VPHKIDGLNSRPVQVGTEKSVQRKGPDATAEGSTTTPARGGDGVHITGSAKQLAALEQMLKDQPVIDAARVARVSTALANGTYEVDPARVADKLLRLEDQLGSASDRD